MRVLVVEDDAGVASALTRGLRRHGWSVRHAPTAEDAVAAIEAADDRIDLVLLDMGLPDHDGLWVCRRLREASAVPIVALTARRAEETVVGALRAGVDDYVTKPYSLPVLQARMEAVLRRAAPEQPTPAPRAFGVELDVGARRLLTAGGAEVALTTKECELLAVLLRAGDRPVTRASLMEEVWDTSWVGASRTLDVHVSSLRAKLGDALVVETVRGVGYRVRAAPEGRTDP